MRASRGDTWRGGGCGMRATDVIGLEACVGTCHGARGTIASASHVRKTSDGHRAYGIAGGGRRGAYGDRSIGSTQPPLPAPSLPSSPWVPILALSGTHPLSHCLPLAAQPPLPLLSTLPLSIIVGTTRHFEQLKLPANIC